MSPHGHAFSFVAPNDAFDGTNGYAVLLTVFDRCCSGVEHALVNDAFSLLVRVCVALPLLGRFALSTGTSSSAVVTKAERLMAELSLKISIRGKGDWLAGRLLKSLATLLGVENQPLPLPCQCTHVTWPIRKIMRQRVDLRLRFGNWSNLGRDYCDLGTLHSSPPLSAVRRPSPLHRVTRLVLSKSLLQHGTRPSAVDGEVITHLPEAIKCQVGQWHRCAQTACLALFSLNKASA